MENNGIHAGYSFDSGAFDFSQVNYSDDADVLDISQIDLSDLPEGGDPA